MGKRRGTSLIEVLVATGILATLLALLLPAVQAARRYANGVADQNNQRQIVLAFHQYAATYGDKLPGRFVPGIGPYAYPYPLVNILPFLDYTIDSRPDGSGNSKIIKLYLFPADSTMG